MLFDTNLTPDLQDLADSLYEKASEQGLDCFETVFELIDYNQLAEVAAYGGFPTRYPHWRFGMEYERIAKSYTYGLSIIYEMVINNDPCYAYLLRANNLVFQKTVIAHVYGHCDFFKNNFWFSKTNRKMLDQMANHASTIKRLIDDIGHDEVEDFIDAVLSLENLIDFNLPFESKVDESVGELELRRQTISKIPAKKYMDGYINPQEFVDSQQEKIDRKKQVCFPNEPQQDVLLFLLKHAPIAEWQKEIVRIIRDEAYYFAPQMQTKILNEGWATYWHSLMMTTIAPLNDSEIVDYCDHYAGVVASQPGQLNPYKLGVELLRHIKKRWDRGQFGLEYQNIEDPKSRAQWDTQSGDGNKKLFEVRKTHNDITFIDDFLDEDFCHEHKMFIYDRDPRTGRYFISGRDFREVKGQLLRQLTNFGRPFIQVIDGNYANRQEILLEHRHEGVDLQTSFAEETMRNLYTIWQRPVHIRTILEDQPKRLSYDGKKHSIEKV